MMTGLNFSNNLERASFNRVVIFLFIEPNETSTRYNMSIPAKWDYAMRARQRYARLVKKEFLAI